MRALFKKIFANYTETVGPRAEIDGIAAVALILQRIFGQQVLDPNWSWRRFIFHYIFFLCTTIYVFFGTLVTFESTHDADMIAEAVYTMIMVFIFPIKLLIFINNRYIFQNLYITAKRDLIPAIKESGNFKHVVLVSKRIVYLLFAMVIIPICNYEFIVLWNYLNGTFIPLSRTTSTLMPEKSPYHELAWIIHTIFICLVSTTIILDMWYVLLIYFLCASGDNLVKNLELKEKKENGTVLYQIALKQHLQKFYEGHVVFIQFLSTMKKMYKWLALVPLCNAAMCVCIILLLLSKDVNCKLAPHVLPMFAEIFVYNWFGEQIKTKATEIKMALLNFDWMSLEPKERKSYYIIVTFVNKAEIAVKTATGNDLSLITMSSVLQITYRAFTVIQSVE